MGASIPGFLMMGIGAGLGVLAGGVGKYRSFLGGGLAALVGGMMNQDLRGRIIVLLELVKKLVRF